MKTFLTLTLLILSFQSNANNFSKTDSNIIFSSKRIYSYEATFINKSGTIVSKEIVILSPLGEPWKWDKNQTSFKIDYNYTFKDSAAFLSYVNPVSKNPKKPKPYFWSKSVITGAIENDSTLWMHPFRENQYVQTEVAPYPNINKALLKVGSEWKSVLNILLGYGNLNGKVMNTYQVVNREDKVLGDLVLKDCWLIKAVGEHNKLGSSHLDFYYHSVYGLVEMNYSFYDGVKVSFILKSVNESL